MTRRHVFAAAALLLALGHPLQAAPPDSRALRHSGPRWHWSQLELSIHANISWYEAKSWQAGAAAGYWVSDCVQVGIQGFAIHEGDDDDSDESGDESAGTDSTTTHTEVMALSDFCLPTVAADSIEPFVGVMAGAAFDERQQGENHGLVGLRAGARIYVSGRIGLSLRYELLRDLIDPAMNGRLMLGAFFLLD